MQILVEVKKSKADFFIELMNQLSFVKKVEVVKKKKSSLNDTSGKFSKKLMLAEKGKIF